MLPIFFSYFIRIKGGLMKGRCNVVSCFPSEKLNMPHTCEHNVTLNEN